MNSHQPLNILVTFPAEEPKTLVGQTAERLRANITWMNVRPGAMPPNMEIYQAVDVLVTFTAFPPPNAAPRLKYVHSFNAGTD